MPNEIVTRSKRLLPFHKRKDKRWSHRKKIITFDMIAVLKMINKILLAPSKSKSLGLRKIMSYAVDSITLLD